MPRRPKRLPDDFTPEEAEILVAAAPSFPTSMAFRIILRAGIKVPEAPSLRRSDLRLNREPTVISVRPEAPGNKGRKVPVRAALQQSLADLALFHFKNRSRPMWNSLSSGSHRA